jgi:hypothetical protein
LPSLLYEGCPDVVVLLLVGRVVLHPLLLDPEPHLDRVPRAGGEAGIVLPDEVALSRFVALPQAEVGEGVEGADDVLLLLLSLIKVHTWIILLVTMM